VSDLESIEQAVCELQGMLGSAIRAERLRLNLMQADVARQAGISRATVIAVEAGQGVSSQNLLALAAAVGLTCVLQVSQPPQERPRSKALMRTQRERASGRRARMAVASGLAPAEAPDVAPYVLTTQVWIPCDTPALAIKKNDRGWIHRGGGIPPKWLTCLRKKSRGSIVIAPMPPSRQ
jgi:transcriptional regulator with XRE-family HTH domain